MSVFAKDRHSGEMQPARNARHTASGRRTGQQFYDHLARVAAIYADAVEAGQAPTKAVAEKLQISRSSAANLVAKARQSGQLTIPAPTPTEAGRLTGR